MAPRRAPGRLAAVLWSASLIAAFAGVALSPDAATARLFVLLLTPVSVAYATVGAVIGARRPANPVGWLFLGWGLALSVMGVAQAYVDRVLAHPGTLPGGPWAAWFMAVWWHPLFVLLVFQLLLFPDGHLPSPRWRHVARATVVVYASLAVSAAFSPSAIALYSPGIDPPVVVAGSGVADAAFGVLLPLQLGLVALAMVSLVLRLRRAAGRPRQQIKGFVFAVVMAVTVFIAGILVFGEGVLFPVFGIIPVAAGIAILRRRLYDIDRILNRTLVYAVLSAVLAGAYAASVLVLGQVFGGASDAAVAVSTLMVAALFRPARSRVQDAVDRRFNRRRYDAARLAGAFAARCRDHVEFGLIATDLATTATRSVEPVHVSLWLRPTAQRAETG
ncbi:MAG TPA: hypothetical protein VK875_07475 [Euzebyales bacterium]|nr:hypothetical protein [Euzebyales bacterium]